MLPACFLSVKKCCFPHLASDVRNGVLLSSQDSDLTKPFALFPLLPPCPSVTACC